MTARRNLTGLLSVTRPDAHRREHSLPSFLNLFEFPFDLSLPLFNARLGLVEGCAEVLFFGHELSLGGIWVIWPCLRISGFKLGQAVAVSFHHSDHAVHDSQELCDQAVLSFRA